MVKQQIVSIAVLVFFSVPALTAEVTVLDEGGDPLATTGVDPGRAALAREVASPVCPSPLDGDIQALDVQAFEVDNAARGGFNAFDPSGPVLINRAEPFLPPLRFDLYEPVPLVPMGYSCKRELLDNCEQDAAFRYTTCVADAETRNWVGIEPWFCSNQLALDQDFCRRTFGCPANYNCVTDAGRIGIDYCCPLDMQACDGVCRKSCNFLQYRNPVTCGCECAIQCKPPLINDAETCACKCPNKCPAGFLQNPRTCECYCPDGLKPCGDRCVDLQTDIKHCGSCGAACAPREGCCAGNCESLNEDPNCGSCGNDCSKQKGKTCCGGKCSDLKADRNNCGACGRRCAVDEHCCNGVCTKINTVTNCGACGRRCAGEQGCCNRQCADLNTKANCGSCGVTCGANENCCNGRCVPLNTVEHCGSCGNACTPARLCDGEEDGGGACTDVPLRCAQGQCACPLQWLDCTSPGRHLFCCPPGDTCHKFMFNGSMRSMCCKPGFIGAVAEGNPNKRTCCGPDQLLDRNGVKTCCPNGTAAALGGETLLPMCCSETEVLPDGNLRLINIDGVNFCRFF